MDRASGGNGSESGAALDESAESNAHGRAEGAGSAPPSEGSAGRGAAPVDGGDELLRALAGTGC